MTPIGLSLILVVIAQILNAVIVLVDKHIVTSTSVTRPSAYAFYVGIISGIVILMVPFGVVTIPTVDVALLSILIGVTFIVSIILLYGALKAASATDVVPWLAAVSTVSVFLLNFFVLQEQLPRAFPAALILLTIGMLLVGHFRFNAKSFVGIVFSGILFGVSTILLKILFEHATPANAFFWSRMGNVFAASLLLLWAPCRAVVFSSSKTMQVKTGYLIITNRVLGGIAFLLTLIAIRLGTVSIVNSLASLQFLFIFLFIYLLRHRMVAQFKHEFRPGHVAHKILAVIFIISGFSVLFL